MDAQFGYVYILTNPSIPGQVKVGRTSRRPEQRVQELSSATSVPEPFELYYYRSFADCKIAERIIHTILEEQGLRTSVNREFFNATPEAVRILVDDVGQRLEAPETAQRFAEVFLGKSQALLDDSDTGVAGLEDALTMLEHAAQLGESRAYYLTGVATLRLLERRRSPSAADREAAIAQAIGHFSEAGGHGDIRGWLQAADLSLSLDNIADYLRFWHKYLEELDERGTMGPEEVDFVLAFMEKNMFSGARAVPPVHPVLQRHSRILCDTALEHHGKGEFSRFVRAYTTTPARMLWERVRLPLAVLVVVLVLCVLNPGVFIAVVGCALVALGFGVTFWRRYQRRRARKAERNARRGRRSALKR